ncbi:MAG: S1 RNA-binding domain-containing protein [bacterium]|nr:S1 RNA-binding domain-containing protein [bacterium]
MEELLASGIDVKAAGRGDVVKGIILSIGSKEMIVDIGQKSEGMLIGREFDAARPLIEKLAVGQEIEAMVIHPDYDDGSILLSLRKLTSDSQWESLDKLLESGKVVEGTILGVNRGGFVVDLGGTRAFLPQSHLDPRSPEKVAVGRTVNIKVLEVDPKQNRVIVSERAARQEEDASRLREVAKSLKVGQDVEGVISAVVHFGVFLRFTTPDGQTVEGLVHTSELAWEPIADPSSTFAVGQTLNVRIISLDPGLGKIGLSRKLAMHDPWRDAVKRYTVGQKVKGKVARQTSFGVFVQIEPGIEGLVHATRLPKDTTFSEGQEVECAITALNERQRFFGLKFRTLPTTS